MTSIKSFISALSTKQGLKKFGLGMGKTLGFIIILCIIALYITSYVGVALITGPVWETNADKDDNEITLKLQSDNIPAYNKLLLIKIWNIMFWVSLTVGFIKLLNM